MKRRAVANGQGRGVRFNPEQAEVLEVFIDSIEHRLGTPLSIGAAVMIAITEWLRQNDAAAAAVVDGRGKA